MSADFEKSLVLIDELMVTDKVRFAVVKGGSQMTGQTYNAIGGSRFLNQIIYSIQLPSLETVMSRHVLQTATIIFEIEGVPIAQDAAKPASGYLFQYGGIDGLAPFPLTQMFESQTISINNTTVSQQTKSLLSVLLRVHDKRSLSRYNGMTPVQYDVVGDYTAIAGTNMNPFASFTNASYDNDLLPRGSYPVTITNLDATKNFNAAGGAAKIQVSILVTEPVLVSPFVWADTDGEAGIYGVQQLNFNFNISTRMDSVVRFGGRMVDRFAGAAIPTVTLIGIDNPSLRVQYITPHASTQLPARSVLPFYSLDRYLSNNTPILAPGASGTVTSSAIQLAMIPDKIYISVSQPRSSQLSNQADAFMTIKSINIQFNNASGLLSSCKQEQLWRFAVEAGSNQSWVEFAGKAQGVPNESDQGVSSISTCGSVLILDFVKHIALAQDWHSCSSLGQFNLLFTLEVENNTNVNYTAAGQLQLLTIVQNSGVCVTERGVSSTYQGILSKKDVLDVSREAPTGYSDTLRMVGGGKVGDFLKRNLASLGQAALKHGGPLLLNLAKQKLGLGESGGASSGGKKPRQTSMGALEDRMY